MAAKNRIGGWVLSNGQAGGWQPEPGDYRDRFFKAAAKPRLAITEPVHLQEEYIPPYRNQGPLGSCTGHGIRGCALYDLRKKGEVFRRPGYDLSTLYPYYRAREDENSINEDSGAYIRDVVKMSYKWGIATEEAWPYRIERFARKPSAQADTTARWHQIKGTYHVCADVDDILQALAHDIPVIGGFSWFSNSDDGGNGHIPLPGGRMEGGHAVWFVGADPHTRELKFQNSWGNWGDGGYGYLPFSFVENGWADDFWACEHEDPPK